MGVDFFEVNFLYADRSVSPKQAYQGGLRVLRQTIGEDPYLLGCGAPILPSVGLVDAMRVSSDIGLTYAPEDGEAFGLGQWSATVNGRGRAWQHGRFCVNDSD